MSEKLQPGAGGMKKIPANRTTAGIEEALFPFENGQTLRQGWSPQCERFSAETEDDWGVLKTTAIQDGEFQPEHNKRLPSALEPDPLLEVQEGDLLLTCAGPRVRCGVICLVRETRRRLMVSGKMYRFRSDARIALATYLEAFLRSHDTKKRIDEMKTGISDSGLNLTLSRFKTIQVPLPPLPEQRRIVAKIEELFSELDEGIENLKQAQAQLAVYRQALLKHAFEGRLTAGWRAAHADQLESADQLLTRIRAEREARYQQQLAEWQAAVHAWEAEGQKSSKPSRPRKSAEIAPLTEEERSVLPVLPSGWAWTRLGHSNVDVFDGPFGSNLKTDDYVGAGIRVIRLENIGVLQFIEEKESFITEKKYNELRDHTVFPGDIVFSSFVTERTRVTIVPALIEKAVNKADCFCVRCHGTTLLNRYACVFLSTRFAYKQLEAVIHGVGRPRINTTQLKELLIPIWSADEQQVLMEKVDEQFSALNEMEAEIEINLQKAEALRQSILKKAFAGELVPQDPADLPAAVLLARIRAAKAKEPKARPLRSRAPKSETAETAPPWTSPTTKVVRFISPTNDWPTSWSIPR